MTKEKGKEKDMRENYYSCAETAKIVRAELKKNFPGIKFSVRSSTYAGGASISVAWTDGPAICAVQQITDQFEGSTFDGMTDTTDYVSREWKGEEVQWGADVISCSRKMSRAFVETVTRQQEQEGEKK